MHTDESKKFDKRNIESQLRRGVITQKEYEAYLSKLPDVGGKIFNPEEDLDNEEELESRRDNEIASKKKGIKKRGKG